MVRPGGLEHRPEEDHPHLGVPEPEGKGRRAAARERGQVVGRSLDVRA